jgi:ABC-type sugar transport system substrate-binding protein
MTTRLSLQTRVALFLPSVGNAYTDLVREDCRAAALRHGFILSESDAENDTNRQVQQIQDALRAPLTARPRALLVSPVEEATLRNVAREAARLGIAWVSLQRECPFLTELRREFPRVALFSVHPDQDQVGRIHAEQLRSVLPKGGEVGYIRGPLMMTSANQRAASFRSAIGGEPFHITSMSGDWSVEAGRQAAKDWLALAGRLKPDACAIVAQNDSMAQGARMAITEAERGSGAGHGLSKIPILGCDGAPNFGHRLVAARTLTATVIIPCPARRAVDTFAAVLAGANPPATDICFAVSSFPDLSALTSAPSKWF